jgi:hypothetical protein
MISSPKKVFVRGSLELGFSSVRHNANPHRGSTFKAPVSGDCGHHGHVGVGHTHLPELTETQLRRPVVILCPWTKLSLCP